MQQPCPQTALFGFFEFQSKFTNYLKWQMQKSFRDFNIWYFGLQFPYPFSQLYISLKHLLLLRCHPAWSILSPSHRYLPSLNQSRFWSHWFHLLIQGLIILYSLKLNLFVSLCANRPLFSKKFAVVEVDLTNKLFITCKEIVW